MFGSLSSALRYKCSAASKSPARSRNIAYRQRAALSCADVDVDVDVVDDDDVDDEAEFDDGERATARSYSSRIFAQQKKKNPI